MTAVDQDPEGLGSATWWTIDNLHEQAGFIDSSGRQMVEMLDGDGGAIRQPVPDPVVVEANRMTRTRRNECARGVYVPVQLRRRVGQAKRVDLRELGAAPRGCSTAKNIQGRPGPSPAE